MEGKDVPILVMKAYNRSGSVPTLVLNFDIRSEWSGSHPGRFTLGERPPPWYLLNRSLGVECMWVNYDFYFILKYRATHNLDSIPGTSRDSLS